MTRDREQAEDLVYEVYVRAYKDFKGKNSEKTWLFSIAKNVAIDHFRKQTVRKKYNDAYFDWDKNELMSERMLPDHSIFRTEQMHELLQALETCTEDQLLVVHLRYLQD